MQEEVENKTVHLAVTTTRFTADAVMKGLRAYVNYRKEDSARLNREDNHGRMTVRQLLHQDQGAQTAEMSKRDIADVQRLCEKYGVDFAVMKDSTEKPPKYLFFFKARDADVFAQILKEHAQNEYINKDRTSVREALKKCVEKARSAPKKVKEKIKEIIR